MTSTSNSQGKTLQVSLVLPAYNEVECLDPAVEKTMAALSKFTDSYEILIAEDGSTDG
jgi:glycosyltransferase involved in cell wall biosynthesis